MILIADGGSTKIDWRLIDGEDVQSFSSKGLNPRRLSVEEIEQELALLEIGTPKLDGITFYGAGCEGEARFILRDALIKRFNTDNVEVVSDILGAARSVCENEKGMVAILGTGSNLCFYDGKAIADKVPALGYLLGDEGSATNLGKIFLKHYLMGDAEPSVKERFIKKFNLSEDEIISKIHMGNDGKIFIASLSKWLFQIKDKELSVYPLVVRSLNDFFDLIDKYFPQYKQHPLHVVGSVGYFWSNVLKAVAKERGVIIGKIVEKPISGLVLWHKENRVEPFD
jgi:N-acetylglucosamine kinase-like BadF-type ATPase